MWPIFALFLLVRRAWCDINQCDPGPSLVHLATLTAYDYTLITMSISWRRASQTASLNKKPIFLHVVSTPWQRTVGTKYGGGVR